MASGIIHVHSAVFISFFFCFSYFLLLLPKGYSYILIFTSTLLKVTRLSWKFSTSQRCQRRKPRIFKDCSKVNAHRWWMAWLAVLISTTIPTVKSILQIRLKVNVTHVMRPNLIAAIACHVLCHVSCVLYGDYTWFRESAVDLFISSFLFVYASTLRVWRILHTSLWKRVPSRNVAHVVCFLTATSQ